ncbi:MAG: hypothetical protein JWM11_5122 [Planctomycetaceae bacterium]|nr:hypothetical protein [Planctomycetaceae bacterium]
MTVSIGCAGWSIPSQLAAQFPLTGSHLERYASRFNAVEINSSFYRSHLTKTYSRWANSTPDDFRFSVKVPREITHQRRLVNVDQELARFLDESAGLGAKLGVLLIQLPPSLKFTPSVAEDFFGSLRQRTSVPIACEPRHAEWFSVRAVQLFEDLHICRVVADPAPVPLAAVPAGSRSLYYFRLHGSPKIYYSNYDTARLTDTARRLIAYQTSGTTSWCIFDNTAEGYAITNGMTFRNLINDFR